MLVVYGKSHCTVTTHLAPNLNMPKSPKMPTNQTERLCMINMASKQ